jgi:hypothetical protein
VKHYSELLKCASFWKDLPYKACLLVQDDGLLVRPGVERFLEYDYVGAPWAVVGNQYMEPFSNREWVGNGGLSLRNCRVMEAVCSAHERDTNRLFAHLPQVLPEDVYFSHYSHKDGHKVCPNKIAQTFAMEQVEDMTAIGFHKFWAYHSVDLVLAYFEGVLGCKMVSRHV